MKSISIDTEKRVGKTIFAISALLFGLIIFLILLSSTLSSFSWVKLCFLILLPIGLYEMFNEVSRTITYKGVKVVAEMKNEDTVRFYNIALNGKVWNESEHQLSNITRIYILKKRKNLRMQIDKFLEYKCKEFKIKATTKVTILPDLFDAKDEDIQKILYFLKENRNEIHLGYAGFWDTLKRDGELS